MKPLQILLFILTVFTVLFAIALFFPDSGINIARNVTLRFISPHDIFSKDSVKYADISDIINQNAGISDTAYTEIMDTVRANADSLKKTITAIEYPRGRSNLLYPFFRALKKAKESGSKVRIMHYGDSQIEGDRITSLIRRRLQSKFGGYGVGLVPASQLYDFSYAILQTNSDNWYRYTLYGTRDTTIRHNRYGALANFCMFEPYREDRPPDTTTRRAWIAFKRSPYGSNNTRSFNQCRIFYGHNSEPFMNEVLVNGVLYDADIIPPSKTLKEITWKFDTPQQNIRLNFIGTSSPEIYGISLEPNNGVIVDNIAMRGCSGTVFTLIDHDLLGAMYSKLGVRLFLLQFGGNVVPHVTDDYTYYEKWFSRQLSQLQSACPEAVIIVIGVADMSIKDKNRYITYPNLEKVRHALRNATFKSGAAYWDMYKAMGGKNSMPSWVFAQPPLASKDFVHFNPRGAVIIAQMFYNALIYDYNRFENAE